jgi:hypothetical protein
MKLSKDIPPRILPCRPHIIKALCRDAYRALNPLQAPVKKLVTANHIPHFLLQLSQTLESLQRRGLRTCCFASNRNMPWSPLSLPRPFSCEPINASVKITANVMGIAHVHIRRRFHYFRFVAKEGVRGWASASPWGRRV